MKKRRKWILPKGIIEADLSPAESAAKEAAEEAGISGTVCEECIGKYRYKKWGGACAVQVYPMKIEKILQDWPETDMRARIWVGVEEAIFFLKLPGIEKMINRAKSMFHVDGKLSCNSD